MRTPDRTPDRWTASRTLPVPQAQQTHNAKLKGRTDNITVRTTMRPHRYLQVPDSACTWPMHPTTAPWGDGPHQLRYKYHTPNRDTYEPRTDTHRPHIRLHEIAVLWTQHRYLRVPDSAYSRSMRPSTRAPGSTVRIGRATSTTDTTDTRRSANTHEQTTEL